MKCIYVFCCLFFSITLFSQDKALFKTTNEVVLNLMNSDSVWNFLNKGLNTDSTCIINIVDSLKLLKKSKFNKKYIGNCKFNIIDSGTIIDTAKLLHSFGGSVYWKCFKNHYFISKSKARTLSLTVPGKSRACVFYFRKVKGGYKIYRNECYDGI